MRIHLHDSNAEHVVRPLDFSRICLPSAVGRYGFGFPVPAARKPVMAPLTLAKLLARTPSSIGSRLLVG